MDWGRRFLGAGALTAGMCLASGAILAQPVSPPGFSSTQVDFTGQAASPDAQQVARWAFEAGNAKGMPFAVVDKKNARIFVFAANGRLTGSTSVLLGRAVGDESAPGVGQKVSTGIPLAERTTPAGRFDSQPGHNNKGEAIVWVDYNAAIAIHRLRPAPASEQRPQRMASANPEDKRISLGCIVVPPEFYDSVVAPTLGHQRGVVYVLPDSRSQDLVFNEPKLAQAGRS